MRKILIAVILLLAGNLYAAPTNVSVTITVSTNILVTSDIEQSGNCQWCGQYLRESATNRWRHVYAERVKTIVYDIGDGAITNIWTRVLIDNTNLQNKVWQNVP